LLHKTDPCRSWNRAAAAVAQQQQRQQHIVSTPILSRTRLDVQTGMP